MEHCFRIVSVENGQTYSNCLSVFHYFHSKLCGNFVFPKNFHTRKLGEITVFYAVTSNISQKVFSTIMAKLLLLAGMTYSAKKFTFRKITSPSHVTLLTGKSLIYVSQYWLRADIRQSSRDRYLYFQ